MLVCIPSVVKRERQDDVGPFFSCDTRRHSTCHYIPTLLPVTGFLRPLYVFSLVRASTRLYLDVLREFGCDHCFVESGAPPESTQQGKS